MADFQVSPRPGSPVGKPRASRISTRIDFTPMVDLGFLLITFFMLTTVLAKPNIMALVMPHDDGTTEPVKRSKVLTLLLSGGDKIYWYEGLEIEKMDSTTFHPHGLRGVILNKKRKVAEKFGFEKFQNPKTGEFSEGSFLNVLIKPAKDSRYKNLVDALDEMAICGVRYYCVLDVSEEEAKRL
jgi:hypothetical protein